MNTKPELTLSRLDAGRLEKLLDSTNGKSFPGIAELEEEVVNARIVEPA